jgi:peptidylprolyl isomerase
VVNAIRQGDLMRSVSIIRVGAAAKAFKSDQRAFQAYQQALRDRRAEASRRRLAAQKAEISQRWPGLEYGKDGLGVKVVKPGQGSKPQIGETVSILYKGMLSSGKVFDSSTAHGNTPIKFRIGAREVIAGFELSARDMRPGEKRLVVIPPDKAYGDSGAGDAIPPGSYLIFELELTAVSR